VADRETGSAPDHKPIAELRKDKWPSEQEVCAQSSSCACKMGLLRRPALPSTAKQVQGREQSRKQLPQGKIQRARSRIEESGAYMMFKWTRRTARLADRPGGRGNRCSDQRRGLGKRWTKLEEEVKRLAAIEKRHCSPTPDASRYADQIPMRSVATSGPRRPAWSPQSTKCVRHNDPSDCRARRGHQTSATDRSHLQPMARRRSRGLRQR